LTLAALPDRQPVVGAHRRISVSPFKLAFQFRRRTREAFPEHYARTTERNQYQLIATCRFTLRGEPEPMPIIIGKYPDCAGVKFGRPRKLSEYQRKEAIRRRAAGETLAEIAKSYAVDISMISRL
jgi:hypothetical protein